MLKYLIIPLSKNATSFCHYSQKEDKEVISDETLQDAIDWALKENVSVQFVYPKEELADSKKRLIDSIDHIDIVPSDADDIKLLSKAAVIVFGNWENVSGYPFKKNCTYIIRTNISSLTCNLKSLYRALKYADRINLILNDPIDYDDTQIKEYEHNLLSIIPYIITEYKKHHFVQLNVLTDRLSLKEMNNCNAGVEVVTLAPNGSFYICPAFYLDNATNVGDIHKGLDIKNSQLYKISHAPICRICDAYQCKRCIWLNRLSTREVNTPGHEQCVVAHIERNASLTLLKELQSHGFMRDSDITEIDYLDPFDKIEK